LTLVFGEQTAQAFENTWLHQQRRSAWEDILRDAGIFPSSTVIPIHKLFELSSLFHGVIKISGEPLAYALKVSDRDHFTGDNPHYAFRYGDRYEQKL
jgi:hypothetical protein